MSIARRAKARVRLLYVHPPSAEVHPEYVPFLTMDESFTGVIKTRQGAYLDELAKKVLGLGGVEVDCTLKEGEVAAMIRQAASEADLIVMATHGRGPVGRFWLGSVADNLLRDLPAPMLLVRPAAGPPVFQPEPELKHILLPLDGTEFGEQIIEPAVALGSLMDADYCLLRVIRPALPAHLMAPGLGATVSESVLLEKIKKIQLQLTHESGQYLDKVAGQMRARKLRVKTRVAAHDHPAAAILEEAASFDLIALETHGRHGLARMFLGSVADKVVRGAGIPVLVHKPKGK